MVTGSLPHNDMMEQMMNPFMSHKAEEGPSYLPKLTVFQSSVNKSKADETPTKLKISLSEQSSGSLIKYLEFQLKKFDKMWAKRAFCQWIDST